MPSLSAMRALGIPSAANLRIIAQSSKVITLHFQVFTFHRRKCSVFERCRHEFLFKVDIAQKPPAASITTRPNVTTRDTGCVRHSRRRSHITKLFSLVGLTYEKEISKSQNVIASSPNDSILRERRQGIWRRASVARSASGSRT